MKAEFYSKEKHHDLLLERTIELLAQGCIIEDESITTNQGESFVKIGQILLTPDENRELILEAIKYVRKLPSSAQTQ